MHVDIMLIADKVRDTKEKSKWARYRRAESYRGAKEMR